MLASDVIALARRRINDPWSDGRYNTSDMLDFLTAACDQMMRDILFPECRVTFATIPNMQEYQLPEIIDYPRAVYVDGRLCPPAPSMDVLEGNALLYYDQRSMAGPPVRGGGGPSGNVGQYAPVWTTQTPASFPAATELNQCVWPAPTTQPWSVCNRPSFYMNGGFMGIVPAPNSGPNVINGEIPNNVDVRVVLAHPVVDDIEMTLWFPRSCRSALSHYIVAECRFSEETQGAMQLGTLAKQNYEREKNQRRSDVLVIKGAGSIDQPKMITGRQYRAFNGQISRQGSF